jgi:prolyl oligopeptidase
MPLTDSVEEIIHGALVRDPYRWLEDRNLPETDDWIRRQKRICGKYFDSFPEINAVERRVRDYLDIEVVDQPACLANKYFYRKRTIGQEQGAICTREISSDDERILVNPFDDGRFTSVGIDRLSPDGALLAYEVRRGGGDRKEIRFVDVNTGTVLPNRIPLGYGRGLAFSQNGYFHCHEIDQAADEHRIRYASFASAGESRAVFRAPRTKGSRLVLTGNAHRLGAIWLRPEGPDVLTDFWIADLVDETPDWTPVFQARRAPYFPILCHERILIVAGTKADSSRLIELSSKGEELGIVVPESETPIRQVVVTRDRIFVSRLDRGIATLDAWMLSGESAGSVDLPRGGTIQILPVHVQDTDHFFYSFESFDVPPTIYQHHALTNTSLVWHQRGPADRIRCSDAQEVVLSSKDGVQFPLTLVAETHENIPNHPRPVIMTSYGGFGVTITPQFSVLAAIMMELGVVFALPHIRGGGEFGKAWHDAGRRRNRQAAFNDFIAGAEWLCRHGVTTPSRLGIFGGSNSGLLVAAVMTQRPDLFGAVLSIAPLLDMIRYESFDQAGNWKQEYGTVDDPEDFQALFAYSPYHHVAENVDYPATLLVAGDKDDRCNPAHVRKMAALLQERPAQKSPLIVDYSEERGHAPVLPLSVRIPALARRIAFLCRELQIPIPNGGFDETTTCS